mgnify:FL=1
MERKFRLTSRRTGHELTCFDCRRERAEDRLTVPCDTGGLTACPFWRTHEASPGEPMAWADVQALEMYHQIQRHGWAMVEALRTFRLSEQEAEGLFLRLDWLTENLPTMIAQWRGEATTAQNAQASSASQNGWA